MSKENTHVTGLSGQYFDKMEVGENGQIVTTTDVLETALRDGATKESWKLHEDIRSEVMAAQTKALGDVGRQAMEKDKNLDKVTTKFQLGRDQVELSYTRSATYPKPNSDESVTKYGVSGAKYTAFGSRNVGDMKKVRERLSEDAANSLAD